MNTKMEIEDILKAVQNGKLGIKSAMEKIRGLPYENLGFAKVDTHRKIRKGYPETIFCPGKTPIQVEKIIKSLLPSKTPILALRAEEKLYKSIKKGIPPAKYYESAKAIVIGEFPKIKTKGKILIITAGTADIPVAEEAFITAKAMGNNVEKLYDVGVAGIHRLFDNKEQIFSANVLIVVAGMEGALPSIIAGMVSSPVIAVPTSIGYGSNFKGLIPLFTMLNSCAPGLAVVNIDNGFGAGYIASIINQINI